MTDPGPLLGWNIETLEPGSDQWTFAGFIPAPDLDAKLSMMGDLLALEIENGQP